MPEQEWLTAAQVARHFQVSPSTVHRWAAADPTMRVKRLGSRTVRIHRSVLERDRMGQGAQTA
ncbi:helix-turn-helix domain-containing protein [Streptomyces sp. NPDC006147]|uniref:helix-turn-helix domain-containing protein n=1 Tax=Streptomyces sp. NPDC006147 TaxID=3155597 RepID=UPI0033AF6B65